jgi:hypothetical protein
MPLTDTRCGRLNLDQNFRKLTDGGGLQLWLQPTGARLWRFAYPCGGKQKLLALGVYPAVPLARAREDARRLFADGLDPAVEKKRQAEARAAPRPFMASPMSMSRNYGERTVLRRPLQRSSGCSVSPTRSLETIR